LITHFDQNENKLLEEIDGQKRFYINNLLSSVVTENKKTSYQNGKINRVEYKLPNENRSIDSIFYESGKISKVEEFLENKKSKISLFNELGTLTQATSFYDVLNLESNYDHNTGETIKRDDDAHNKQETLFYENGYKKLETTYFNDLKNGLEIAYYETGNLERETTYLKGKKHKNEILYWNHTTKEPKQILNEEYATEIEKSRRNADKKNIETYNYGSLTERNLYDSLGRKKQMNSIKNNKNQGTFEFYYPSGSLKSKGNIDTLSNAQDHFFGDYFEYHEQGYYKGSQWVQDVLMHLYYRMDGKVINKRSHPFYFGEKFAEDIIGNPFILGNIEVAEFDFPVYAENQFSLAYLNNTCTQLGEGWRLPTKDELKLIFDSLCVLNKSIFHDGKNYNLYLTGETFSKTIVKENVLVGLGRPPQDREETHTYYECLQFVSPGKQPIWVNNLSN
jgi:antitoxin component YwqK of YwqJK toxin-antitoxin module